MTMRVHRPGEAQYERLISGSEKLQKFFADSDITAGEAVNLALFWVAHMFHDIDDSLPDATQTREVIATLMRRYLEQMEVQLGQRAMVTVPFGAVADPSGPPPHIVSIDLDKQVAAILDLYAKGPSALTTDSIAAVLITVVDELSAAMPSGRRLVRLQGLEGEQ